MISTATGSEQHLASGAAACKPNISPAGRRMRLRFGAAWLALSVGALATSIALGAPWYWRALAGFPAALSAIGFLQASRHTCVARAREGNFERQDLSRTKAPDADVVASRRVAATIVRDALLIGAVCAAVAAATILVA